MRISLLAHLVSNTSLLSSAGSAGEQHISWLSWLVVDGCPHAAAGGLAVGVGVADAPCAEETNEHIFQEIREDMRAFITRQRAAGSAGLDGSLECWSAESVWARYFPAGGLGQLRAAELSC